jgi:hypothetical protein
MRDIKKLYNPFTIKNLAKVGLDGSFWTSYISELFPSDDFPEIDESTTVIVDNPDYFKRLGDLVDVSSPKALREYIIW